MVCLRDDMDGSGVSAGLGWGRFVGLGRSGVSDGLVRTGAGWRVTAGAGRYGKAWNVADAGGRVRDGMSRMT